MSHPAASLESFGERRLPRLVDDVLVHVFSYLTFDDRVAVSHSSAHFRAVITHVPAFWTEIFLRSGRDAALHRLATLLARSAPRAIIIDLCMRVPRPADAILAAVSAHLHRVRALTLQLSVRHRTALLSALVAPASRLESVTVCFFDSPSDDPWDLVADELPPTLFARCAPVLRSAAFDAVYLPAEGVPALARVRELTVEYSADAPLDLSALLRNCPDAESLGVAIGLHYTDLTNLVPGPGFTNLQTLTLYMTARRALSSPCFAVLLSCLQFHDVPSVAVHYRGAPPAADLAAYLAPAPTDGPASVALGFEYGRPPAPLERHALHALRDVAFSVSLSTAAGQTRTLTAWYDLSPHTLARPGALAPRMIRAALSQQVTALEVRGSTAWDVLAAETVDLSGVADLTFVTQRSPAQPRVLFPCTRLRFPALRTVQLRGAPEVLREAAVYWPGFLRDCVGADMRRPPPYALVDPARSRTS